MKVYVLIFLLSTTTLGQQILNQKDVGRNACGPCAIINQLTLGGSRLKPSLKKLPGNTPKAKAESIISTFGAKKSRAYRGARNRYKSTSGIACRDLLEIANEVVKAGSKEKTNRGPFFSGNFLDRGKNESTLAHLKRVHANILESLKAATPPILSIRSFAPFFNKEKNKHFWQGLGGHVVVITKVQPAIEDGELSFWFKYADSDGGRKGLAMIQIEQMRNFAAMRGNMTYFKWIGNRPFLTINAPSLNLYTSTVEWQFRTIMTANYLIYRRRATK